MKDPSCRNCQLGIKLKRQTILDKISSIITYKRQNIYSERKGGIRVDPPLTLEVQVTIFPGKNLLGTLTDQELTSSWKLFALVLCECFPLQQGWGIEQTA